MTTITINFTNNDKYLRDVEDFCAITGYVDSPENTETKEDYVKRLLKSHFKEVANANRRRIAIDNIVIQD